MKRLFRADWYSPSLQKLGGIHLTASSLEEAEKIAADEGRKMGFTRPAFVRDLSASAASQALRYQREVLA